MNTWATTIMVRILPVMLTRLRLTESATVSRMLDVLEAVARPATLLLLVGALSLTACAQPVRGPALQSTGDPYLRVEYTVEPAKDSDSKLTGYVYNERDMWAANVLLSVEVLDAAGAVVDSTTDLVYGNIPPRNRSFFDVKLPTTGASYRVTVRTVDWRGYGAGGA